MESYGERHSLVPAPCGAWTLELDRTSSPLVYPRERQPNIKFAPPICDQHHKIKPSTPARPTSHVSSISAYAPEEQHDHSGHLRGVPAFVPPPLGVWVSVAPSIFIQVRMIVDSGSAALLASHPPRPSAVPAGWATRKSSHGARAHGLDSATSASRRASW